jgi:hypothetical protein
MILYFQPSRLPKLSVFQILVAALLVHVLFVVKTEPRLSLYKHREARLIFILLHHPPPPPDQRLPDQRLPDRFC